MLAVMTSIIELMFGNGPVPENQFSVVERVQPRLAVWVDLGRVYPIGGRPLGTVP